MEKGKEETKEKNLFFEEKKRTTKDTNATISSFNELAVAGGLLLFRKVEEKILVELDL